MLDSLFYEALVTLKAIAWFYQEEDIFISYLALFIALAISNLLNFTNLSKYKFI